MNEVKKVDVCIVGGGPAGMVLALLLAHKGVRVLVLEKNRDFSREYRGEVLMPRFTQMFRNLGLDKWLTSLPHLKLEFGQIFFQHRLVGKLDFSKAAPDVPYALWMPQTVLLNALHDFAKRFSTFEMWFGASVKHLVQNNGIQGVVAQRDGNEVTIDARVTVGADGRYSTVFREGKFEIEYEDYKFDVLWFTIGKPKNYENTFKVLLSPKRSYLLLPKYPDAIQVGILVAPHEMARMKAQGISGVKQELKEASPLFKDFADAMKDFTDFHPLQAHLHYVKEWAKEGCVLIGDSAHCCSPAGAIGVSVAVGTAIIAADIIVKGLRTKSGILPKDLLDEIQQIRTEDVKMIHRIQKGITGGLLGRVLPVRWLIPLMVSILAKTPFFLLAQRRLMVLSKPLPVSKELLFNEEESV